MTVAPVVVSPEKDSNKASTNDKAVLGESVKGSALKQPSVM